MEDYKFLNAAFLYGQRHLDEEKFMTIAHEWAKSQNSGKPLVSGSLPLLMARRELLEELMKERFPLPKKAIAERCNKVGNEIGSIVFKRQ